MSINTVTISGNITRDVDFKTLPSGTKVANFGMAVSENRKNQQGGWDEVTHFVDCVAFNGQATTIAKFAKGKLVTVSGRLQYRTWEQQDGVKRSKLEVLAEQVIGDSMYIKSGEAPQQAAAPAQGQAAPPVSAAAASNGAGGVDDDIPF